MVRAAPFSDAHRPEGGPHEPQTRLRSLAIGLREVAGGERPAPPKPSPTRDRNGETREDLQ